MGREAKDTLLGYRMQQLEEHLDRILDEVELIRKVRQRPLAESHAEMFRCLSVLNRYTSEAYMTARQVEDLSDVVTYGPGGGR